MKSAAIGLSLTLCVCLAAKEIKLRTAWIRTFPNSSLTIMPDNGGHIAAVGIETNSTVALLFNRHGREIARAVVPIPSIASATADNSGRIFVTGNEPGSKSVYCAAFASSLSRLLWAEEKNLSNRYSPLSVAAGPGVIVPDEAGSAYVFGKWNRGFFFAEFRGDASGLKSIWDPYGNSYTKYPKAGIRSPSGEIYFVAASVALSHLPWITIQKFTPATHELITYGAEWPSGRAYSLPQAVVCDADGNLIIVGWHADDPFTNFRLGNYFTLKMDAQLNVLWRARYGPLGGLIHDRTTIARAVATTRNSEIVVSGGVGTVKYSRDGRMLWETAEWGDTLRLDRFGNVLLIKQAARDDGINECELTKLNSADGTLRWQTRFHDGGAYDNWPAGLMADDDGDIYFAALNGEQSTVVKLVEHGPGKQK
jgi:hypothetical protein